MQAQSSSKADLTATLFSVLLTFVERLLGREVLFLSIFPRHWPPCTLFPHRLSSSHVGHGIRLQERQAVPGPGPRHACPFGLAQFSPILAASFFYLQSLERLSPTFTFLPVPASVQRALICRCLAGPSVGQDSVWLARHSFCSTNNVGCWDNILKSQFLTNLGNLSPNMPATQWFTLHVDFTAI